MWLRTQLLRKRVPLCAFLLFPLQPTFSDDLETCTDPVLPFLRSIQVPCLSSWFWQTRFSLSSKNMVCQNQPETQGTWVDCGKRSTELVQITESSQKSDWRKKQKRAQSDCSLQKLCSQSHSVLIFVSTVHIFNPIAHFFSHGFCLFAQRRKKAETVAGRMNNRIKNVNDRKKIENRMWLRTQRLQERVPLGVLFCFFPFSQLFVMTWRLAQILYSFSIVKASSSSLRLILANQVFAWKQKLGLPKSTGETSNLH